LVYDQCPLGTVLHSCVGQVNCKQCVKVQIYTDCMLPVVSSLHLLTVVSYVMFQTKRWHFSDTRSVVKEWGKETEIPVTLGQHPMWTQVPSPPSAVGTCLPTG